MNSQRQGKDLLQAFYGIASLFLMYIGFVIAKHWFGTFYTAGWEQYKNWYPNFHFLVFPVVKVLPFAIFGILIFLLRKKLVSFLQLIILIPAALFTAGGLIKKTVLKYLPGFLILTVTLAIVLPIVEYFLLKKGFKPGYRLYSIYFHPVDSLYNIEGFYADSNGVFCISQPAREFIRCELAEKNFPHELTPYAKNESPEVYSLPEDFLKLRDSNYHSAFKSFLAEINSSNDSSEHDFFEAVKQYVACPINSNGFKSIEFKKYNSKRKIILLLGDSFTWGHSTANKTNCFADLLLAKGYIVYNTGVSGTDPAQYLQLVKVLVPRLAPDYVIVNFYMGNDIQYFNREPVPFMPVLYCTNAGNLVSCPEGVYLHSVEEAYDYTLSVFTLPVENNFFNKLCSKTAFGTLTWRAFAKIGLADVTLPRFMEYTKKVKQAATAQPYSDKKLMEILEITRQHGGKFLLLAIPSLEGQKFVFPSNHKGLFEGLEYFVPPVKKEHYNSYDRHFNDAGSGVYAEFIDSLIRAD